MAQGPGTTSVFTDDSGTRQRLITWTVRTVIAVIAIAGLAIGLSLATGVPLPTPAGPLHLPGIGGSAPHGSSGSADESGIEQAPSVPTPASPSATSTPNTSQGRP